MSENQLIDKQSVDSQLLDDPSQQNKISQKPLSSMSKWLSFFNTDRLRQSKLGSFGQKFSELTLSQWLYFIAAILLFLSVDQDVEADSSLIWVGAIAGIGLMRELWHVFNRLWDNVLGKGFIFVLYAATANFALAIAALKVNAIAGIEPSPFVFTIGFTTLLMLPFWLMVSSIVFFSVALLVSNLWLFLSVLLRLIRIKVKVHWEDSSFVFATMLLRVILIPYVIMSIFFVAVPFAEQIEILDNPIAQVRKVIEEQEQPDSDVSVVVDPEVAELLTADSHLESGVFDQIIAHFIYYFETYPKSACKKTDNQRSLRIDENLILLVEKDESAMGYYFSVGPCEGNYASPTSQ